MATLSSTGRFAAGEACADNDILYGPYATTEAAHAALLNAEQNVVGRTVGIQTGNTIEEYWYQGGTTEQHLVKKQSSEVEANPTGEATTTLNKIKIGETNYNIPQTDTSNLATKQELQQGLNGKQDTISDLEQIRTRANEGHTALQPKQSGQYTQSNIVIFDANGGLSDSQKKTTDFATAAQGAKADNAIPMPIGTDGQILEKDSNETAGVKWVNKPSDGKSAYQLYVDGGGTLTQEQWLASLKANIGAFQFITPTDTTAEAALTTIGSTYASAIGGVSPTQSTLNIILLMNDSNNTKTMMIATQEVTPATTPASYEFIYAGDLQSAMPSNVLTEYNIVNDLTTGGVNDVLSAEQGKFIADTTMELVESLNILDPSTITLSRFVKGGTNGQGDVSGSSSSSIYGCTDFIEIGDGVICNHSTESGGTYVCGCCVYDSSKKYIGYTSSTEYGGSIVVNKNITLKGTPEEGADTIDRHYVRFNLFDPTYLSEGVPYDGITDGYAVYKGTTLPTSFQSYFTPYWEQKEANIKDNAITTQKIADGAVTIDKMADIIEEYASDNILNPDTCIFEYKKYISFITGNISTSSLSTSKANGYTDYIPIDSRGIVFNHGVKTGTTIGAAVYYLDGQGNKVFKRGNIGSNNGKDQVIVVNYDAGDQSLPDSDPGHYPDAFVRFTISNDGAANNVMCNIGTVLKDYVPYGGIKKMLSPDIIPNSDTNVEQVLEQEKIFTDALKVALPDKFYAVRGDVLQLFHKGVVYAIDFANRYAMPTCGKGTQYRRYYELNATKVVFVVSSSVSVAVGDVYSTQGNTYEVTKVATEGSTKSVTCNFKGSATITSSGTLTKVSGSGDASVAYTKFTDTVAAGEYPYTLTIYDDNRNILGEGSSVIKLVNFPTSPITNKNILCIGASTTAGGQWVCETQRRLLGTGVNPTYENSPKGDGLDSTKIKFIGSLSKTLYGQTSSFFAKSGWSWEDFATAGRYAIRFYLEGTNRITIGTKYTNNGHTYEVIELNTIDGVETIRCSTASGNTPSPHGDNVTGTLTLSSGDGDATLTYIKSEVDGSNPFWNQTQLDFQNYVENICGETALDMMIIVLGANAMFSISLEQQEEYVRTFIEACHADYPDCKIILVGSSSPSMINMLPGYGVGGNSFGNTYLVKCRLLDIFEMYKTIAVDYDYVEYESWAGQFDSDYNFPLTQKDVNIRNNSVQEPYANNTIHPGDAGYMQFADAAYRSIVAHLCQ